MTRTFLNLLWLFCIFLFGFFSSDIFYTISSGFNPNPNGILRKQGDIYELFYRDLQMDPSFSPSLNQAGFSYKLGNCNFTISMPAIWKNESRMALETTLEPECTGRGLTILAYVFKAPRNRSKFINLVNSGEDLFTISNVEVSIARKNGVFQVSLRNLYIA